MEIKRHPHFVNLDTEVREQLQGEMGVTAAYLSEERVHLETEKRF